jgi:hypothetical protein
MPNFSHLPHFRAADFVDFDVRPIRSGDQL